MDEYEFPKPSNLLVAASVLVIGICLIFATWSLEVYLRSSRDFTAILVGLSVPFWAALAMSQYCGTFCYVSSTASVSSALLYLFGCVGGITSSMMLAGANTTSRSLWAMLFVALSMGTFTAGVLNIAWGDQLRAAHRDGLPAPRPIGFSLRELMGAMVVMSVCAGIATWMVGPRIQHGPVIRENLPTDRTPSSVPQGEHEQ